ncbi:sigma-70 family RNA polymerase sigma factor [Glaciecola siphonariae]|uniref:Sigma-70 family RNA polymerase sigma factor n=1 Tax=Glaciecola siphonariae TaxID=521012 RepID=A0ABV9LW94_9ALTE
MKQVSNEDLMLQYKGGNFAAFEQLYAKNKGPLYRYLRRQLHNKNLVDDMFQDVWGKVVSHAHSYEASAKFTTWLFTIARHKLIDHIRHLKSVPKAHLPSNHVTNHSADGATDHASDAYHDNCDDGFFNFQSEHEHEHANNRDLGSTPESAFEQRAQKEAILQCLNQLPKHQLDCFLLKEEAALTAADIAVVVDASLEAVKSRFRAAYSNLRACLARKLDISGLVQPVADANLKRQSHE